MAELKLRGARKSYGNVEIIKGIDLDVEDREFVVFVGPSGCGKSTLLRMIAGLEKISAGDLLIDGVRANDIDPSERGLAMVFQSYARWRRCLEPRPRRLAFTAFVDIRAAWPRSRSCGRHSELKCLEASGPAPAPAAGRQRSAPGAPSAR